MRVNNDKDTPTQAQMSDPSNAGRGEPNYVDDSVESPLNNFYPNRGEDAPAYVASNPRYWEYR